MSEYVSIYQKNIRVKKILSFFRRNYISLNVIFLIVFSLILIIQDSKNEPGFLNSTKIKLNNLFYPVKFSHYIGLPFKNFYNSTTESLYEKSISEIEYQNMVESIKKLYIAENEQLKTLLNYIDENAIDKTNIVTTRAIVDLKNHNLILSCGKNENIKPDQLIINNIGLVGKITEVYENFSKGILITNKKFKLPVISAESGYRFIINGQNNKYLKPLYLSDELNNNELILLSDDIYMRNIHIGKFNSTANKIEILINLAKLNFVSIIKTE
jgi:rod shape-determining protein MreC